MTRHIIIGTNNSLQVREAFEVITGRQGLEYVCHIQMINEGTFQWYSGGTPTYMDVNPSGAISEIVCRGRNGFDILATLELFSSARPLIVRDPEYSMGNYRIQIRPLDDGTAVGEARAEPLDRLATELRTALPDTVVFLAQIPSVPTTYRVVPQGECIRDGVFS